MTAVYLATMLLVAAQGNTLDDARKAYSNCLVDFTNESLETKKPTSAFRDEVTTKCQAERGAFHNIIVADERRYGSSQAEAAQYADEECQGILSGWISSYVDYLDSGSRPMPE